MDAASATLSKPQKAVPRASYSESPVIVLGSDASEKLHFYPSSNLKLESVDFQICSVDELERLCESFAAIDLQGRRFTFATNPSLNNLLGLSAILF